MYCLNDFEESLKLVPLESPPFSVVRAWGRSDEGSDRCCQDWRGGFVIDLGNKRFAYLTGWCDYTGWGCQDGATITYGYHIDELIADDLGESWDEEPADLNRWIKNGMKPWEQR